MRGRYSKAEVASLKSKYPNYTIISTLDKPSKIDEPSPRQKIPTGAAPTPTPKPTEMPKEEKPWYQKVYEAISPTKKIAEAITGREEDKVLTPLERVQKVTSAVATVGVAAAAAAGLGSLALGTAGAASAAKTITVYKTAGVGSKVATAALKTATTAGYASNVKTLTLTSKILATLGISGGAVTLAMAVLGSYPFAGFVGKEEATQTLGFGYRAAMDAGDYDLAEEALNEVDELLNALPTLGDKVPISNVMNAIEDFTDGAKITLKAQRELVKRMRDGTDKWSLINEEKEETEKRITANRIEQWEEANENERDARKRYNKARDKREREILLETAELWKKHKEETIELEKKAREASAKFWLEYSKEKSNLGKSQLAFGLLG